ncbi:hypothetical protein R2B70_09100 [Aeromonas sp. XH]|uniref:hypothetical protein n=1 Tax=Aeromonas sp. XH TaxID=3081770 RepID=UPI0029673DC6|nr:hypothetical protein [Aeromonas sp. XH]WOX50113.1 hypothetical protein R2B70_09100 [Aeromonas sp. XH]
MNSLDVKLIQVNIINNYILSAFPEERIKILISELNVHYGKINNYIEMDVASENINIEFIDVYAKLNEIIRLSPTKISHDQFSGDYMLSKDILDSILALLQIAPRDCKIQNKLKDLGLNLVERVFGNDIQSVILDGLFYRWLDKYKLIVKFDISMPTINYEAFGLSDDENNEPKKIKFEPSDNELNSFYEANKISIYKNMVEEKNGFINFKDPFSEPHIKDFYHYYYSLSSKGINKTT